MSGAKAPTPLPQLKRYEPDPPPPPPAPDESFEAIVDRVLGETITTADGEAASRRELLARVLVEEAIVKRNPQLMRLLVEHMTARKSW